MGRKRLNHGVCIGCVIKKIDDGYILSSIDGDVDTNTKFFKTLDLLLEFVKTTYFPQELALLEDWEKRMKAGGRGNPFFGNLPGDEWKEDEDDDDEEN